MQVAEQEHFLVGKDEHARSLIAARVGKRLAVEDLPDAERRAAESLAFELACDAIERVRLELSKAVRHARFLPRDLALQIAHDVDSVACPFLEVTEVFSESDWQQISLTMSRGARVAAARRSSMSEGLARNLSELGDSIVVEALIENPASPMTEPVCYTLVDRFASDTGILDKLAQRDDLVVAIAVKLIAKVSAAARQKLLQSYNLPDFTEPIGAEVEDAALLQLVRQVSETRLPDLVRNLKKRGKLSFSLLLAALHENLVSFVEVALSDLADMQLESVKVIILQGEAGELFQLLRKARFPEAMDRDFWNTLQVVRSKNEG